MGLHDGLLRWTIPAGRWGGTTVRASALIPLVGVAAAVRAADLAVGAAALAGLTVTAIAAEAARCVAAARLGAPVRRLLIWPLGGLEPAEDTPARAAWVHLLVPAAALLVCTAFWGVVRVAEWPISFGPDPTPAGALLIAASFVAIANLLPAWPLATGRALRDHWAGRSGPTVADAAVAGLTHLFGVIWLFLAVAAGSAWIAAAAAAVMLASRERRPRPRRTPPRDADETFLGYDFSAGYTSLERAERDADGSPDDGSPDDGSPDDGPFGDEADAEPGGQEERTDSEGGSLSERRRRRDAARRRREREERRRDDLEVDRLLRKISAEGESALTAGDRRTLKRAAARLRQAPPDDCPPSD